MVPVNKFADKFLNDNLSQSLYPTLIRDWGKIFGNLKDKVRLEKAYKHTIVLGVEDSSWMHELHLLSNILIDKINEHLPEPQVKKISFRITEFKKRKKPSIQKEVELKDVRIENRETFALKKIEDSDLATELKKFLIKCKQK